MLGYIAFALLLLLIGLAIQPALLVEKARAIALAVVLVLGGTRGGVVPPHRCSMRLSNIERG
jgi:hypothetical protein